MFELPPVGCRLGLTRDRRIIIARNGDQTKVSSNAASRMRSQRGQPPGLGVAVGRSAVWGSAALSWNEELDGSGMGGGAADPILGRAAAVGSARRWSGHRRGGRHGGQPLRSVQMDHAFGPGRSGRRPFLIHTPVSLCKWTPKRLVWRDFHVSSAYSF